MDTRNLTIAHLALGFRVWGLAVGFRGLGLRFDGLGFGAWH